MRLQRTSSPSYWSVGKFVLGTDRFEFRRLLCVIPLASREVPNLAGNRGLEPPICWLTASDPRPVRTLPKIHLHLFRLAVERGADTFIPLRSQSGYNVGSTLFFVVFLSMAI